MEVFSMRCISYFNPSISNDKNLKEILYLCEKFSKATPEPTAYSAFLEMYEPYDGIIDNTELKKYLKAIAFHVNGFVQKELLSSLNKFKHSSSKTCLPKKL